MLLPERELLELAQPQPDGARLAKAQRRRRIAVATAPAIGAPAVRRPPARLRGGAEPGGERVELRAALRLRLRGRLAE